MQICAVTALRLNGPGARPPLTGRLVRATAAAPTAD